MSARFDPIRYAVVGLGYIAQVAVLPAFRHAARNSRLAALVSGDPTTNVHLGAVVDSHTIERMGELIGDARAKGAVVLGGVIEGNVMSPAVVDRVTPAMRIYSEESFGPAVSVVRVVDEAQALEVANDTEYGLSAAVFSRSSPVS